nr:MAG TPA: Major capsid protein [Bacteriophage sp.]
MAVAKFIQTIWSKKIQDDLEEKCKLVKDCTREYEGDCKYANTVKILGVGEPSIGGYVGQDITIEEMSDKDQLLTIDVQNYFAFMVNDVDKAQSVPGLPEKFQQKAMRRLALKREKFIGALVAGKAQSTADEVAGNDTYKEGATHIITATGKTQAAIKTAITDGIVSLRERNFDDSGVIEIDPRTYATFKDALVELKTNNDELIKRGVVGMYDDYEVKSTNNIYKDNTHAYCIIRSKNAIAFAGQINEVEAGRMERRFSDYIRGLDTFGAKIIAQDELVVVKIPL